MVHTTCDIAAAEREGNDFKGLDRLLPQNGSTQGQNLAMTVSFVPDSLGSGVSKLRCLHEAWCMCSQPRAFVLATGGLEGYLAHKKTQPPLRPP